MIIQNQTTGTRLIRKNKMISLAVSGVGFTHTARAFNKVGIYGKGYVIRGDATDEGLKQRFVEADPDAASHNRP